MKQEETETCELCELYENADTLETLNLKNSRISQRKKARYLSARDFQRILKHQKSAE